MYVINDDALDPTHVEKKIKPSFQVEKVSPIEDCFDMLKITYSGKTKPILHSSLNKGVLLSLFKIENIRSQFYFKTKACKVKLDHVENLCHFLFHDDNDEDEAELVVEQDQFISEEEGKFVKFELKFSGYITSKTV